MKIPSSDIYISSWPEATFQKWQCMADRLGSVSQSAGKSDGYQKTLKQAAELILQGSFSALGSFVSQRAGVRAITQLWLEDTNARKKTLRVRVLDSIATQHPQLTRITLLQIVQLYFREFDRLDHLENGPVSITERMAEIIRENLERFGKSGQSRGALDNLSRYAECLISEEGPKNIVDYVVLERRELQEFFNGLDLTWVMDGRFAEICRSVYYLESLKLVPVGKYDSVMDELSKPAVHKAPFENGKRIGHAALEILIDRTQGDPSEEWRDLILGIAGDPRITGRSRNYVEWWQSLGLERINKVRGWLSKLDIDIFLKALEDYSENSGKDELKRMFPARKRFLSGLIDLNVVRSSRLMLGSQVENNLRRILDQDMRNLSYAKLTMSDKALVYLDCGDFFILEGSHSFKIWVYLARPPEDVMLDYNYTVYSFEDLTKYIPRAFEEQYPSLPVLSVTHNPNVGWQHKVISFLAEHGIGLDAEKVLTRSDYNTMLNRYSLTAPQRHKILIPDPLPLKRPVIRKR